MSNENENRDVERRLTDAADSLRKEMEGFDGAAFSSRLYKTLGIQPEGEAREVSTQKPTIEILRINSDGENVRNEQGQKTTAVDVEIAGMGNVRLLIHHDVASALYGAVCEE